MGINMNSTPTLSKQRSRDSIRCVLTAKETATTEMSNNNKVLVLYVYERLNLILLRLSSFSSLMHQHHIQMNLRSAFRLKYANILWFTSGKFHDEIILWAYTLFFSQMRNPGCGRKKPVLNCVISNLRYQSMDSGIWTQILSVALFYSRIRTCAFCCNVTQLDFGLHTGVYYRASIRMNRCTFVIHQMFLATGRNMSLHVASQLVCSYTICCQRIRNEEKHADGRRSCENWNCV